MKSISKQTFKPRIFKVCFTGGPCGGKTTASTVIKEKLGDRFILYFLPELAASTVTSGVTIVPHEFTHDTHTVFTQAIMEMQMQMEDYYAKIASIQKKDVLIISDRGCIDNLAYASPETRERVLRENNWALEKIRDQRYDAVIHLVTAADGALEFYTLANNAARTETPEVARWIDKRTQEVWNGHPNYTIISNTGFSSFQQKIEEAYKCICKVIDIPEEPSIVVKYRLKGAFNIDQLPADISHQSYHELIHYLPSSEENEISWVKKRTSLQTKGDTFIHVRRRLSKIAAERLEFSRIIDQRQYGEDLLVADPGRKPVTKDITVFLHDNFKYVVESFSAGDEHLYSLSIYTFDKKLIKIPPFLEVSEDITENPKYFTSALFGPK